MINNANMYSNTLMYVVTHTCIVFVRVSLKCPLIIKLTEGYQSILTLFISKQTYDTHALYTTLHELSSFI